MNTLALERQRRTWVYVSTPTELCYGECPKCGGSDYLWSEFYPFVWCLNCKDDVIPAHYGVVDGPCPIRACEMMGMCFDAFDLLTHNVIPFDSEFWPDKLLEIKL